MKYRVAIGPSTFAEENPAPMQRLIDAGCDVLENASKRRLTEEEIIAHLQGIDGLIAGLEPLNRRVIESAPQLKAIARVGIGVANVDFDAARDHGVKVSSTPEGPVIAVSELTVAALLALARNLISANSALHARQWKKSIGTGLSNTRVLFVGYGRIGRRTATLLRAFGAHIAVYDPFLTPEALREGEEWVADLKTGLAHTEVVTMHAAGNDCLIGPEEFEAIENPVILLNSARGELVDENALVQALQSGKVRAAWFDAFWKEPYTGPLCDFEQVLLTPHTATYTAQCRLDMEMAAVENLLRDLGLQ